MTTAITLGQRRKQLDTFLHSGQAEIAKSLPGGKKGMEQRFIRLALTAVTKTPKLLDCSKSSVALSLMNAAAMGLEPDGYHAHLVPYGNTCQLIPDYKGLIQLALRNDVLITARVVYEKDEFAFEYGTDSKIKHVPYMGDEDRGEMKCSYAIARFKDGGQLFVVADKRDILKRKNASRAGASKSSPWQQWPEMMWCKTAVKMLTKYTPISVELQRAIQTDDQAEIGSTHFASETVKDSFQNIVESDTESNPGSQTQATEEKVRGKRGKDTKLFDGDMVDGEVVADPN